MKTADLSTLPGAARHTLDFCYGVQLQDNAGASPKAKHGRVDSCREFGEKIKQESSALPSCFPIQANTAHQKKKLNKQKNRQLICVGGAIFHSLVDIFEKT